MTSLLDFFRGKPSAPEVSFEIESRTETGLFLLHERTAGLLRENGYSVSKSKGVSECRKGKSRFRIGVRDGKFFVECSETDRGFCVTLIDELLSGLAKEHRADYPIFIDPHWRKTIRTGVSGSTEQTLAPFRLCFSSELLRPKMMATTKSGAVTELIDLMQDAGVLEDRYSAAKAVFEREAAVSTGLENGVAVPHGRTDAVETLTVAVGLKPSGLSDYETIDGKPVRIVILVLAPLNASVPQLQFLALIGRVLDARGRAELLSCDTAEDMQAFFLSRVGQKIQPDGVHPSLQWQSISVNLGVGTKTEALEKMLVLCSRSGGLVSINDARQALLAREKVGASGLENGIALPHCRTEAVDRLVCAVGISREGIDFGAVDGLPAQIIIMILIPPSVTTEYNHLVACLMKVLDEKGRAALLGAKTTQEALAVLTVSV